VQLVGEAGEFVELQSDTQGRVRPEGAGPWLVHVDDPEFVPYFGIAGGESSWGITLLRGATVEVQIVDGETPAPSALPLLLLPGAGSAPMGGPGWRARSKEWSSRSQPILEHLTRLFEPSSTIAVRQGLLRAKDRSGSFFAFAKNAQEYGMLKRLAIDSLGPLRREAGHDGTAHWSRLPPGEHYIWAIDAPVLAHFEPERAQGWDGSGPLCEDCSGPFSLEEAQVVTFRATLSPSGGISGRIPPKTIEPWNAKIEALLEGTTTNDAGQTYHAWLKAAEVVPDWSGEFLFEALPPGRYRIEAAWSEELAQQALATAITEIKAFETRDVGALNAEGGVVQTFRLELQDEASAPLDPQTIFANPSEFSVWVYLSLRSEDLDMIFVQRFPADLSHPVVFKGLPPGEYSLRWDFKTQPELLASSDGKSRTIRLGGRYIELRVLGGTSTIPIIIETKLAVSLELPSITTLKRPKATARVFSPDRPPVWVTFEVEYEGGADETPAFARFLPANTELYPGPKRVLLSILDSDPATGAALGAGARFIDMQLDTLSSAPILLPPSQPACSITGKVDPAKLWMGEVYAILTPQGMLPANDNFGVTTIQPDGHFRVDGLPAHTTISLQGFDDDADNITLITGTPGSTVELED
jgi:hypothetical protein